MNGEKMNNKAVIQQATIDILPLALAVVPWGILCGTIAIDIGMSLWQAQAMSLFVFAGAAQLSAMSLMGAGAGWMPIGSSVFAISSRHLLYSIDLRKEVFRLSWAWRVALAFFLTDEMYAVSKTHLHRHGIFSPLYSLTSGIVFYLIWNLSTYIGIVAGRQIDQLEHYGLEFAIVAVFIAITAPHLRKLSMIVATVVSALGAIYFKEIFPDSYVIIASLMGMSAGYIVSGKEQ